MIVELETGGNVRVEDGKPSDVWYSSCADLVRSRLNLGDLQHAGVRDVSITRVLRIRMLRADLLNFTSADGAAVATIGVPREAPALFYEPIVRRYFLWCSRATGWRANAAEVFSASALSGPWRSEGNPTHNATSFESQSTFILPVTGRDGRARFVYVADRFEPFISGPLCGAGQLCESGRYVWLPIDVAPPTAPRAPRGAAVEKTTASGLASNGGALRVTWRDSWTFGEL